MYNFILYWITAYLHPRHFVLLITFLINAPLIRRCPIQIPWCSTDNVIPLFLLVWHNTGGPVRERGVWFQTQLVWSYLGGGDVGGWGMELH